MRGEDYEEEKSKFKGTYLSILCNFGDNYEEKKSKFW